MKIVILSGGTGSVQLQRGIHQLFAKIPDLDITVLVNAYDNGLSTGLVRKVADGNILGPSDVRKNQTLLHEMSFGKTDLLEFLNIRFSLPAHKVEKYAQKEIAKLASSLSAYKVAIIDEAVRTFFDSENSKLIDYDDFSLSNIVYAGLAMQNKNVEAYAIYTYINTNGELV